ncbi:DUF2628 domain-containing protein [Bifidobacterium pullorum]|uniref:DUF2628 domain-containing protein n=2 Tax=Bifidobacterium TaxID=1678 RepID=UPI000529F3D5|nr:DUF2628 domain-containing protein [Bifidobacterium pullorum]
MMNNGRKTHRGFYIFCAVFFILGGIWLAVAGAWPAAVLFVIVGIAFAVASYRIGVRQKRRREQIRRDAGFTD